MKRLVPVCLLLVVCLLTLVTASTEDSPATFTAQSYAVSPSENLNYWLFTPKNAKEGMPLLIYLHGGSGKGDDLSKLTQNGFCQWVSEGRFDELPAYIIFPQVSSSYKGWSDVKRSLKSLIDDAVKCYGIDTTRISLTGHSMGGTGTFAVAAAYPRLFSAVAPMSGSIANTQENVAALSALRVWAFVGGKDTVVAPQSSRDFIASLQSVGAAARLTEFPNADHFSVPELAYLDESLGVVNWLISQKKENRIIGAGDGKIALRVQQPGDYVLIACALGQQGKIAVKPCTLTYGMNEIELATTERMRIFLLQSLTSLIPVCPVYRTNP